MKKIRKNIKIKSSWKIQNGKVSYVCSQCNTKEDIPDDVVNLFDILDTGDPSVPPLHHDLVVKDVVALCYLFEFARRAFCSVE